MTQPPDLASGYLQAVGQRLAADGCQPQWQNWQGTNVLLGRRADMKALNKIHLFVVATAAPEVSLASMQAFTHQTREWVKYVKNSTNTALSGLIVLPAMVSARVDPYAMQWAAIENQMEFGTMTRPILVDLAARQRAAYVGTPLLGWALAGYARRKIDLYFPQP